MNLSEEAKVALERLRTATNGCAKAYADELASTYPELTLDHCDTFTVLSALSTRDAFTVAEAMLDLFPVREIGGRVIRWDDDITPERLVACGSTSEQYGKHVRRFMINEVEWFLQPSGGSWWKLNGQSLNPAVCPRNMGEAWNLMERCGIEVPNEHA